MEEWSQETEDAYLEQLPDREKPAGLVGSQLMICLIVCVLYGWCRLLHPPLADALLAKWNVVCSASAQSLLEELQQLASWIVNRW